MEFYHLVGSLRPTAHFGGDYAACDLVLGLFAVVFLGGLCRAQVYVATPARPAKDVVAYEGCRVSFVLVNLLLKTRGLCKHECYGEAAGSYLYWLLFNLFGVQKFNFPVRRLFSIVTCYLDVLFNGVLFDQSFF